MKQRGFILPSGLTLYAAIGAIIIIVLLSAALKVQSSRLDAVKSEYDGFVAQTKAAGKLQEAKTKETESKHIKITKEKDNEIDVARTNHANDLKRLRDKHTRGGIVPTAPADSVKPSLACFDRQELSEAIRDFTGEVGELVAKGQSCAIELNNAREWANNLTRSQ